MRGWAAGPCRVGGVRVRVDSSACGEFLYPALGNWKRMSAHSKTKMFTVASSPRAILDGLNGSEIRIAPLEPMFTHWPMAINQHRERLEVDVNARIDSYVFANQMVLIMF